MDHDISQVEHRIKRYWYTDGIGELIGGGIFLLLGLYFSMQQYFGDESPVGALLQTGLIVILIGGMFLGRWLINLLKTRITYPRTGYVEYSAGGGNVIWMRILSVVIAITVTVVSVFIARSIKTIDSMVATTGVLVAVILVVKQGWSSGVRRFYLLSAISLLLGGLLSLSGLARGYNLGLFYGLMGVAFAISGGLTLVHYLGANPLSSEAGNDQ